jgi:hypothetical protein
MRKDGGQKDVHLGGSKINFREPVIKNDSNYIVADMS